MSCNAVSQIPAPPTALASCAVPIGGSNSSILDSCCNSHINSFSTYAAPGAGNARSDDGCFQFCTTDNPDYVSGCLTNTLGEYETSALMFECFNVGNVKKDNGAEASGYGNAAGSIAVGRSWALGVIVGLTMVGMVVGSVFNAPALLFSSIYFLRSSDYDSGYDSLLMFILVLLTPARAIARRLGLMLIIVLAVAVSVAMTMTIADSMM